VAGPIVLDPGFIDGSSGRLLVMRWAPAHAAIRGEVLLIPPFGEEMNRSRRQFALTGQAFAAHGLATSLLDLTGTGDSDGDFADATCDRWIDDIRHAIRAVGKKSRSPLTLLGLRLGGLLALGAAGGLNPPPERIVLWQPVVGGDAFLTQTLRIRLAAALGGGGAGETTQSLRQRLAGGETLEIAGYPIAPAMAAGLDRLRMAEPPAGCRILWLEAGSEARAEIGPAGMRTVERWRQSGHRVATASVPGAPFWSLMETETAPALIEATIPFLAEPVPA